MQQCINAIIAARYFTMKNLHKLLHIAYEHGKNDMSVKLFEMWVKEVMKNGNLTKRK